MFVDLRVFLPRRFHRFGGFVFDFERIPFLDFGVGELAGFGAPTVERLGVCFSQFGISGADAFVDRFHPVFAPFQTQVERAIQQFGREVSDVNGLVGHGAKYRVLFERILSIRRAC